MKENLEVIYDADNKPLFLNYWDSILGNDVCAKIIDGKLVDKNGRGKEISLTEFLGRVAKSAERAEKYCLSKY